MGVEEEEEEVIEDLKESLLMAKHLVSSAKFLIQKCRSVLRNLQSQWNVFSGWKMFSSSHLVWKSSA